MKALRIVAAIVLVLHGLIHLMGTISYLKLAQVQGLPYKTTVLEDRIDLGAFGIGIFGVVWAVTAFGFVIAAIAILLNRSWW